MQVKPWMVNHISHVVEYHFCYRLCIMGIYHWFNMEQTLIIEPNKEEIVSHNTFQFVNASQNVIEWHSKSESLIFRTQTIVLNNGHHLCKLSF